MVTLSLETTISHTDAESLFHWQEHVFPIEGRDYQWAPTSHHILARNKNQQAIGHIGYGSFRVESDGKSLEIIGVGGVVMRPEYQGLGIPSQMFDLLHKNKGTSNPTLYALFCPARLQSYYNQFGYKRYTGQLKVIQNQQLVTCGFSFMYRGKSRFGTETHLTTAPW